MTQRQLQLLCAFRIKIGIDLNSEVTCAGREDATASSCNRGTAHSLSADAKVASQGLFGFGDQAVNGSANPSRLAIHFEKLQSPPERAGQTLDEGRARELDTAADYDHFNLVAGQPGERFGRAKPGIADHQHIRYRTGLEAAFPLLPAKDLCSTTGDHSIECICIKANSCVGEFDFIEQITGGGQRRIATQHHGIKRMNEV